MSVLVIDPLPLVVLRALHQPLLILPGLSHDRAIRFDVVVLSVHSARLQFDLTS